jgi:hypothetical protein
VVPVEAWTLAARSLTVKPPGAADRASTAVRAVRMRGLFRSTPPTRVAPIWEARGVRRVRRREETDVDAVQGAAEPVDHAVQALDDGGELVDCSAQTQFFGVVHDRFEPQYALAFGVALQRQTSEVELEQGQVIPRCLDHDCQGWWPARAVAVRAVLRSEQGAQDRHVQAGTGPVEDCVEHPVHPGTQPEDQVAAVLDLVDGVAVAEAAAGLLIGTQAETQTGGVDPPVADLAQPPIVAGCDKVSAT